MPPKARYNDKARAGGLAKAQAVRDARKHGRKLPQGPAPKSKKQKALDKYIDAKLRTDEKVKLIEKLAAQPKILGLSSTKVMKRTKNQDKKEDARDSDRQVFAGDSDSEGGSEVDSEDSESYLDISQARITQASAATPTTDVSTGSKRSFGFSTAIEAVPHKPKKQKLKYTWRARLEEEKRRKAGILSESPENSDNETSAREEEEESDASDVKPDELQETRLAQKREAFKEWATEQTGSRVQESNFTTNYQHEADEPRIPRPRSQSPEPIDRSDLKAHKLTPVLIERAAAIEDARSNLPAYAHEQELVEKIKTHSTVIISGATGSGKTTQIPQFLYEAGFKGIGITQPRRVAAVSMARRVATEMGSESSVVGYQIRFESSVKAGTQVKFMTDGVLLRELSVDFMLSKYEVIIIDEAHERSINTDILIGVLSRVVRLRKDSEKPLRLVIMSATLRVSDFADNQKLFSFPPPIMSIEARQYPVTVHFSKRTEMSSYVEEAFRKICKIHDKLPPGGILIFLTGQQEIQQCSKLLREHFGRKVIKNDSIVDLTTRLKPQEQILETEDYDAINDATNKTGTDLKRKSIDKDDYDDASDSDLSDIEETEDDRKTPKELKEQKFVQILPLYSLLPTTEQMKVFQPPPAQCRQIILATNVAETSLTIPGIRYVVDSGRAKTRKYNGRVQSFEIDWISKASADQRSGRAGRTGPGHAYRLFSSAVYDSAFPEFSDAEILNTPIDGIVLQMKSMNIHTIVNFPFPTPPDRTALAAAEKLLAILGALDHQGLITELGKQMSLFPLAPRFGKMIVVADQDGVLPYVTVLVSAMSVDDPFIRPEAIHDDDANADDVDDNTSALHMTEERKRVRQAYFRSLGKFSRLDPTSDALRLLMAVCAADYAPDLAQFCKDHFLRLKAMEEIRKLRMQLINVIRSTTEAAVPVSLKLSPPTSTQILLIHKILASAFLDQICIRADLLGKEALRKGNLLRVPYVPLSPLEYGQEFAYIHPSSHNIKNASASEPPEYLLYSSLSSSSSNPDMTRIKVLAPIEASWIAEVAQDTPLLKYGKPLLSNLTQVQVLDGGRRRKVPVVPTLQMNGSGRQGWPLPPIMMSQKLVNGRWVNE